MTNSHTEPIKTLKYVAKFKTMNNGEDTLFAGKMLLNRCHLNIC